MSRLPYSEATVWFLTGSQDLYGEDTLAQVAAQSKAVASTLAEDLPVALRWEPVLIDADGIVEVMHRANADAHCVGIIAWMHTFSPAKLWIGGLRALGKPLLHLHTQANEALPWSALDMDFMNLNQSAHGDREFGYILTRLGVPRVTVVGHVSHATVRARVGAWSRVATALAHLHGLTVARFGDNMRRVAVTDGDKVRAESQYGVAVDTYGVNDLVEAIHGVDEVTVDGLIEEYLHTYDVADLLRPGGERDASLREGARQEAGLRSFLEATDAEAFTTNFQDLGGLRQLPGLAVQRLMAAGYGFGAEGDWKTAFLLRALKVATEGLPGGTSFMEDYTYHLGPGQPLILGSHMLEVCPSIAESRPTLEIHPLTIGDRDPPVRLRFTAQPGPGTVVGLSDLGNRFRLVSNAIDVVGPPEPLPLLPVACATWAPRPTLDLATEGWLTAGGPHHTVFSTTVTPEMIEMFGTLTGTELVLIDSDTTRRGLAQEMRANELYFALQAGR
jgi:L-arabinose isomerase